MPFWLGEPPPDRARPVGDNRRGPDRHQNRIRVPHGELWRWGDGPFACATVAPSAPIRYASGAETYRFVMGMGSPPSSELARVGIPAAQTLPQRRDLLRTRPRNAAPLLSATTAQPLKAISWPPLPIERCDDGNSALGRGLPSPFRLFNYPKRRHNHCAAARSLCRDGTPLVGLSTRFLLPLHDGGGCEQRDIHMIRDAALLIGLGLLTVGYWGALGWAIWWAI
jgi:hypothetical protein